MKIAHTLLALVAAIDAEVDDEVALLQMQVQGQQQSVQGKQKGNNDDDEDPELDEEIEGSGGRKLDDDAAFMQLHAQYVPGQQHVQEKRKGNEDEDPELDEEIEGTGNGMKLDDDAAFMQLHAHPKGQHRSSKVAEADADDKGTLAAEKIRAIADTKDEQQASLLVEDLAESAVEGKVEIDDGAKAALMAMKTTLENSQELIKAAHNTDQTLRQTHADKAAECLTNYDNAKNEDAALAVSTEQKHTSHESCRERLAIEDADMVTKCEDLASFINNVNPPCSSPGREGMGDFWSGLKSYHDSNFPTWQVKEEACKTAEEKRAATDAECDGLQRDFETGFCSLRLEMTTTCSEYAGCHNLAVDEFNDVMAATAQAETSRKIEWVAIEKIKCYIDVLVSDGSNEERQAALTACKDLDPDTSHLDLTTPIIPDPIACDLSSVAVYPCIDGFENTRYAGMMDLTDCQSCPPLPNHLNSFNGGSCGTITDDGNGWKAGGADVSPITVGDTKYHSYDNTQQTVEKDINLSPGVNYKWTAVIDTWASVDNEPMRFCAISEEFGEVCDDFSTRSHNSCNNGWTEHPTNFGTQVNSPGSSHASFKDCYKDFEKTITGPTSGNVKIRMYMAIDQARSDEAWGWHDMKLEPTACPPEKKPFALESAKKVCSKSDMLAAGWSWTGCPNNHHGGSSLCAGIWCHSEAQMHLKVPPLAGSGTCTATWQNAHNSGVGNNFVRLMKNGEQLGEALANEEKTVTFSYTEGDELELWEGFAIAKATEDWLSCDTGAAAAAVVSAPVNVNKALQIDSREIMLAHDWTWTGCGGGITSDGSSLKNGIWCSGTTEMHLRVPLEGGPSTCTATFQNAYSNTGATGFVRLMKNGQQVGEALAGETKTVTFTFADGDQIDLWEGFAIAQATGNWISCS